MKRVIPSSKFRAIRKAMATPQPTISTDSDVVDIDHVVNVVILQNDLLIFDQRLIARKIERVERCAEVGVYGLVAEIERGPVEPQLAGTVLLLDDFHIGDVVRCPRLGEAGCA